MASEDNGTAPLDYLKSWPLYPLPHHLLSRAMLGLTRLESRLLVAPAIRLFSRQFKVNLDEALQPDPAAYTHFNDFFTRELKPGARPIDSAADSVVCPADGAVSQAGMIQDGRIFQAKGHDYSLKELLGGDTQRAAPFRNGRFATIYLSPRDYHRVHMPLAGTLREMVYVPGRLFSVAPHTVRAVPGLFARNERVVAIFDTEQGPLAMVLVGAIFVACIETVWCGVVTPPHGDRVTVDLYPQENAPRLEKGAEMGRFNMGSTVILLSGPDALEWTDACAPDQPVRMGQVIGKTR